MNWISRNPFNAALLAITAIVFGVGGWFVYAEMERAAAAQEAFDGQVSRFSQLTGNAPFPDASNIEAVRHEVEEARKILAELSEGLVPQTASPSAKSFQDELAGLVKQLEQEATANSVKLPENFYLGFEKYRTQLPQDAIRGKLQAQLQSINAVVQTLIASKITRIESLTRSPVPGELPEAGKTDAAAEADAEGSDPMEIVPFQVAFEADQPSFRLAFNRVSDLVPPVLVHSVSIRNSSPQAPEKAAAGAAAATPADGAVQAPPPAGEIKPILGSETLNVVMDLSSVVAWTPATPPTP